MQPLVIIAVVFTNILLSIIFWRYFRRSQLEKDTQNKKKLSSIIGSLTDGVMMVDGGFNLVVTNPVLGSLLGRDSEIRSLSDVVSAIGDKVNLQETISQAFAKQSVINLPEIEIGNKTLQIDVEPVKDYQGLLLGVVVIFHDISSRKALEKVHKDFTAMMIHELRTPLTTIIYSVDMIKTDLEKLTPSEIRRNLDVVKLTTNDMLSLVNQLLDVSKIEAGKFEVVKKDDDLGLLVEEKVAEFKPLADQKHLFLTTQIEPNLPRVAFDKNRLGEVINNLLSNALKYTDHGGVSIRARVSENEPSITPGIAVVVSVVDTGEGIKVEDQPKLFSKFEQLGKGKTGEKNGTGLGLVVSKGIVEAHGGKIWVVSEGEGHGTTVSFSLPLSSR